MSVLSACLVLWSGLRFLWPWLGARERPAQAQVRTAYPEKRGFKLSDFPRTIKLADNVYGYEEIRQPGFTTVSLFVVGQRRRPHRGRPGQCRSDEEAARRDREGHDQADQVVRRRIRSRRSHRGQLGLAERHHLRRDAVLEGADEARRAGDGRRQAGDRRRRHRGAGALSRPRAHRRRSRGLPAEAEDPLHERGLPQSRVSRRCDRPIPPSGSA